MGNDDESGYAVKGHDRVEPTVLPLVSPDDQPLDDWITLGDVVIWIASSGTPMPSADVAERLDEAQITLVMSLASDRITAWGAQPGGYEEPIPKNAWGPLRRRIEHRTAISPVPRPYLRWVPHDPSEPLEDDDVLSEYTDHRGTCWQNIRFKKQEVKTVWPGPAALPDSIYDDVSYSLGGGPAAAQPIGSAKPISPADLVVWFDATFQRFVDEKAPILDGYSCVVKPSHISAETGLPGDVLTTAS